MGTIESVQAAVPWKTRTVSVPKRKFRPSFRSTLRFVFRIACVVR